MAITMETMRARLRAWAQDESGVWLSDSLVEEALRLAVEAYNRALGAQAGLAGLDGASASSLPEGHAGLVLLGAAGFAAQGRCARRLSAWNAGQGVPAELAAWGAAQMQAFTAGLERARTAALNGGSAPWGDAGWNEPGAAEGQ